MHTKRDLPKNDIPLLILAVLLDAPRHGYAIAREVERLSADALQMREGTLYPALRVLEQDGLITGAWEIQPVGPARKIYTLTEAGQAELKKRMRTGKTTPASWARFWELARKAMVTSMNNRRNLYLREMEARLRHLPETDRAEEMAEITQHFDALIAACQAEGKTEAESVEEAVAQFGAARDIGSRLYHADKHKRFVPLIDVGLFFVVFSLLILFADQGVCYAIKAAVFGLALRGVVPEAAAQNLLQIVRPHTFVVWPFGWSLYFALFLGSIATLARRYGLRGAMEKARQSPPVKAVLRLVVISYLLGCLSLRVWYHIFAVMTHPPASTMPVGFLVTSNITPLCLRVLSPILLAEPIEAGKASPMRLDAPLLSARQSGFYSRCFS